MDAAIERSLKRVTATMFGDRVRKSLELRYRINRVRTALDGIIRSQKQFALAGQFRPVHARMSFGDDGALPPVRLQTESGLELQIVGRIDRIDLGQPNASGVRPALAVTYKLSASALDMAMVFHGRDVELLILLLALAGAGDRLGDEPIMPAAALAVATSRSIRNVADPDDANSPDDPVFWLEPKPRGIIDTQLLRQFDKDLATGASRVVSAFIKKDGELGLPARSDLVNSTQLAALLNHVEQCLVAAADQMLRGDIDIRPYMHNKTTPCPHCAFRDVCRIERGHREYDRIESTDRVTVLRSLPQIPE
jgi:ATP-dependent helicase/nuclease subunit B